MAPVKAPLSWPNSSLSNSVSGRLAQSTTTSGRRRGAGLVHRARHQLLAGAGFAQQQHAGFRGPTRATSSSMAWKAGARPISPGAAG
jgi:hypothetical protein